jgi:hypothetical protein
VYITALALAYDYFSDTYLAIKCRLNKHSSCYVIYRAIGVKMVELLDFLFGH